MLDKDWQDAYPTRGKIINQGRKDAIAINTDFRAWGIIWSEVVFYI